MILPLLKRREEEEGTGQSIETEELTAVIQVRRRMEKAKLSQAERKTKIVGERKVETPLLVHHLRQP